MCVPVGIMSESPDMDALLMTARERCLADANGGFAGIDIRIEPTFSEAGRRLRFSSRNRPWMWSMSSLQHQHGPGYMLGIVHVKQSCHHKIR